MFKRKLIFFFIIFSQHIIIFSQNNNIPSIYSKPKSTINLNGRKISSQGKIFALIGIKVKEEQDNFTISLYFNDSLDTNSIKVQAILINNKSINPDTNFLFNKSRRMTQFSIPKENENFSIVITNLRSITGRNMNPIEIKNLSADSFTKYSRQEKKWQKSSL